MKILVSGAGGFLGQHLVQLLLKRGHSVRAILRSKLAAAPSWIRDVEPFYADLTKDELEGAFDGVEVVIHLAGGAGNGSEVASEASVIATERLFQVMASSKTKRLIHISSLSVYDWTLAHGTLDENTPILSNYDGIGQYAISKVSQETLALRFSKANAWATTIIRPGFIWGPGRADIAGMGRRWNRFYLVFGPFTQLPLCHVDNCSDLIAVVVERGTIANNIFNAIDNYSIKVWRYVYEYIARTHQFGLVLPVPYAVGLQAARLASFVNIWTIKSKRIPSLLAPRRFEAQFKPLKFSRDKVQNELNWNAPLDFEACLDITFGKLPDTA